MEKTNKQRRLYFMRVSENCKLMTELYIVPDEFNHQQTWFEDRHLQEVIILLRDPIKAKVVSHYEQTKKKKWAGVKEGNDSKKQPITDEHQITTGQSVKIGYKFVDSNMHHHSCLMPSEIGSPVWKDDNSRHAGGGFITARLFAKKLVVFVCKYHPSTVGHTTSQLMKSLCATPPPSKHIAISSYFAPKADDDFVGQAITESAHRKRNKLKKIVKGMKTEAPGLKDKTDLQGQSKSGGFFEQEFGRTDTETADEIKPEILPSPSVSDMDCNSDGVPDPDEQFGGGPSLLDSKEVEGNHKTVTCRLENMENAAVDLPPMVGVSSSEGTSECVKAEGNRYLNDHKIVTCKLENIEDVVVDSPMKVDGSSSEGTYSSTTYESRLKGSLNSTKSESTIRSSSVGQESGIGRLTWTSEATESSPSSSGDFDYKPRRQNVRSRNKLSLKRAEGKRGGASKVGSSKKKVLCDDVIKESAEEAEHGQDTREIVAEESLKQKIHSDTVPLMDDSSNKKSNNVSESVRHPISDCSVLLTDIKLRCPETVSETLKEETSPELPDINQEEILLAPEQETAPKSSSDDELISVSFLHTAEAKPSTKKAKESKQHLPSHTKYDSDIYINGSEEASTASSRVEQREQTGNLKNKRSKQSRLALSSRQSNKDKDTIHNTSKDSSHFGKKRQKPHIKKLLMELAFDSDSQGSSQNSPHKIKENQRFSGEEEEPMDVEDGSPKTSPVVVGSSHDEVDGLSSDNHHSGENQRPSPPGLKQDDLVHISDDSSGGGTSLVGDVEKRPAGENQAGQPGDREDEVIDLSQGVDDGEESDSWFDNIFGNVRFVTELKTADMVYLTQRNRKYLHNIFQGKRHCERHQCYKKKGPHRIAMGSNVRLGPFKEEQMDAVMGELVKIYCAKHIKFMDYVSKVLLPEAMTKIYMDVHSVSHTHAEEVMRGVQKEHPRAT
ncbi:uncharacterized protein LOC121418352 isoform X2 [Lytechinus variegatus]|uniref:uncharacterized protein LOC121418352 isoform X2 n=1 Tax=Lytechinus variegatus TaxID=7654 RepID=UPI001BB197BD|nr:uncharacterized protein LOC121418352 isoform X2 [Lytechinus variegatus]